MRTLRAERTFKGQVFVEPVAYSHLLVACPVSRLLMMGLGFLGLFLALCGEAPAQNESSTLMLVREWNAKTGELIGWLPNHQLTMGLELLSSRGVAHYDLDQVVTLTWVKRDDSEPGASGDLRIMPGAREFEGKKWVPVSREANLVHIKSNLFLIRQIVFESSSYRQSKKARLEACSDQDNPVNSYAASCPHGQGE